MYSIFYWSVHACLITLHKLQWLCDITWYLRLYMVNQKEKGTKYLRPVSRLHLRIDLKEIRETTVNCINSQYFDSDSYWTLPTYITHSRLCYIPFLRYLHVTHTFNLFVGFKLWMIWTLRKCWQSCFFGFLAQIVSQYQCLCTYYFLVLISYHFIFNCSPCTVLLTLFKDIDQGHKK